LSAIKLDTAMVALVRIKRHSCISGGARSSL
jgi:hypothetical protein